MGVILSAEDLSPFADIDEAKADAMIDDAEALTFRVAPCLASSDEAGVLAAAKAILRGAVLRWHESGTASYQAQTAGPPGYPTDPRRERRNLLWPSEVTALQELCSTTDEGASGAFTIDLLGTATVHADICALTFGAVYCSCGADLTDYEYPLYEGGVLTPEVL